MRRARRVSSARLYSISGLLWFSRVGANVGSKYTRAKSGGTSVSATPSSKRASTVPGIDGPKVWSKPWAPCSGYSGLCE